MNGACKLKMQVETGFRSACFTFHCGSTPQWNADFGCTGTCCVINHILFEISTMFEDII